MNCLQFFIFTRFFAVFKVEDLDENELWIAYNFLSLQGSLQLDKTKYLTALGCELLTIFYLYKVLCSEQIRANNERIVVNCLQFFIFTRFFAVHKKMIADQISCELLTIFYLYKVLCSIYFLTICSTTVVNCLQFFIFTRFFAVFVLNVCLKVLLWIAYNFLSLQGSLQCLLLLQTTFLRCELLTIFYLYKVLCSL